MIRIRKSAWKVIEGALLETQNVAKWVSTKSGDERLINADTGDHLSPGWVVAMALRTWNPDLKAQEGMRLIDAEVRKHGGWRKWKKLKDAICVDRFPDDLLNDVVGSWDKIKHNRNPWIVAKERSNAQPYRFDKRRYDVGYGEGYHRFLSLVVTMGDLASDLWPDVVEEHGPRCVPLPRAMIAKVLVLSANTVKKVYVPAARAKTLDHPDRHGWLSLVQEAQPRRTAEIYRVAEARVNKEGLAEPVEPFRRDEYEPVEVKVRKRKNTRVEDDDDEHDPSWDGVYD